MHTYVVLALFPLSSPLYYIYIHTVQHHTGFEGGLSGGVGLAGADKRVCYFLIVP